MKFIFSSSWFWFTTESSRECFFATLYAAWPILRLASKKVFSNCLLLSISYPIFSRVTPAYSEACWTVREVLSWALQTKRAAMAFLMSNIRSLAYASITFLRSACSLSASSSNFGFIWVMVNIGLFLIFSSVCGITNARELFLRFWGTQLLRRFYCWPCIRESLLCLSCYSTSYWRRASPPVAESPPVNF